MINRNLNCINLMDIFYIITNKLNKWRNLYDYFYIKQ